MAKQAKKNEKKKIDYKYNIRECWSLLKNHKILLFSVVFLLFLVNLIGFLNKYLFKELIDRGTFFIDGSLARTDFVSALYIIGAIFVGAFLLNILINWTTQALQMRLERKYLYDLKKKYFSHILDLSHNFHSSHNAGELISKLGRGSSSVVRLVDNTFWRFAPFISQLILIGVSFAYFSPKLLIVLVITLVLFIYASFNILKRQQKVLTKFNESHDKENSYISNSLTNIESIKLFGKEFEIKNRFSKRVKTTIHYLIEQWQYYKYFDASQLFIFGVGTLILMALSLKDFLDGNITIGTLAYIYTIYMTFTITVTDFVFGVRTAYEAMNGMQGLFNYGKIENEIKDKENAKDIKIEKGKIDFKNVNFSYDKKKNILKKFNLEIKPNEKIAFVGHSGSGKTTIVKLLNRLYDVQSGDILIDGISIKDVKQESLRSETGIVPQETILFDDTIYNNIKFSRPSATKAEVMNALKLAKLDQIVKAFPKKENTFVGDRGVKLSGGEKQRVSIARAILANKKILVLDEATSALDSHTEHDIQKALNELLKGRTSIIIAHRLSTIMNADRIIVMKSGRIVEEGNHKELLKKKGAYSKLWEMQSGGYMAD